MVTVALRGFKRDVTPVPTTTTAKTPLRPAQRYSQNSFNVALCNSDSQQRAVIVQQEIVTGLWIRAPARAHASREQPALRQGRPRCRRVGWCWNLPCQESLDQLVSALSRLLHNARYSAVSRWSFWLGAERWLQALVLILDRPASSFVDRYDAARTCTVMRRTQQFRSVGAPDSCQLTHAASLIAGFLWLLPI